MSVNTYDHGSDSDFDDDDFGHDVTTVASALKITMKRFNEIIDQIGPWYIILLLLELIKWNFSKLTVGILYVPKLASPLVKVNK